MTAEEIVYRIRASTDATETADLMLRLLKSLEGLTITWSRPYRQTIELDELLSLSFLAASQAAEEWDPERAGFITIYKYKLLAELSAAAATEGTSVYVPSHMRSRIRQYRQYLNNYRSRYGESPSDPDVCKDLGITGVDLQQIRMAEQALYVSYLDAPASDDEDSITVGETIPDRATDVETTCLEQIFRAELTETLYKACESLPEEERKCLTLRFKKGLTLGQIAAEMGLEVKTVRKLSDKALRRLRDKRNGLSGFLRERTLTQHVGFDSWAHNGASSPEMLILKYEQHDYGKWH